MTQHTDNDAGGSAVPDMVRRFRISRQNLVLGIIGTACFLTMGVASTAAAYWNVDASFPYPLSTACLFGVVYFCLTLLGVRLILAYFRTVSIDSAAVAVVGVLKSSIIYRDDVKLITWRPFPAKGRIVVRSFGERIKLDFGDFTPEQRTELIAVFHGTFADSVQQGWSRFADRYPNDVQGRRRKPSWALVYLLLIVGIVGIVVRLWLAFRSHR